MINDPKNELTIDNLLSPISSATNNSASAGLDVIGTASQIAMRVKVGVQTAGDNNATFTVKLQHSDTNSAAAATDVTGATLVTAGNNSAFASSVSVDPRGLKRYVFSRIVITGGNSPAAPVSVDLIRRKQTQS
jgi:hypothetical protein